MTEMTNVEMQQVDGGSLLRTIAGGAIIAAGALTLDPMLVVIGIAVTQS